MTPTTPQHAFRIRGCCPLCSSTQGDQLCDVAFKEEPLRGYLLKFYGSQGFINLEELGDARYVLIRCLECRFVYQKQVPSFALLDLLYEHWIDPVRARELFLETRKPDQFARLAHQLGQTLERLRKPHPEVRILDFGAGWGNFCLLARAFECQVEAIELSPSRIERIESLGIPIVAFERLLPNRYDFIHTEQVFEHLTDPRATLSALANALRVGGIVKLSVPNGADIARRLKRWNWISEKGSKDSLNAVAPLEHLNCFNHFSLRRLAALVGLRYLPSFDRPKAWPARLARRVRGAGTCLFFEKPA